MATRAWLLPCARVADLACLRLCPHEVLDDLERLLGHVTLSGGADGAEASEAAEGALQLSPAILEALHAHLRRPPAAGRQLMLIGVTSARRILARTPLLGGFDAVTLAAQA